jgi:hypothetical protein
MTVLGNDLLVADPLKPAIYRIHTESLAVNEFGGRDYRNELQLIASRQKFERLLYDAGLGLALFFLLLVLILAVRNQRRQRRQIIAAKP